MESEALRNLRTMRHVRTFGDIARTRGVRTMNSISKTDGETEAPALLTDRRLRHVLYEEKRRFNAFERTVERSRQRILRSREKLATTINRNRALMTLRHELQQARSDGDNTELSLADIPSAPQGLRQIELNY